MLSSSAQKPFPRHAGGALPKNGPVAAPARGPGVFSALFSSKTGPRGQVVPRARPEKNVEIPRNSSEDVDSPFRHPARGFPKNPLQPFAAGFGGSYPLFASQSAPHLGTRAVSARGKRRNTAKFFRGPDSGRRPFKIGLLPVLQGARLFTPPFPQNQPPPPRLRKGLILRKTSKFL